MDAPNSVIGDVAATLSAQGVDLAALGLSWARAMPLVTLVPALGLRALPAPARMVMGLAFAACILPAIQATGIITGVPWAFALAGELVRGLPVAVGTAVPLYAATMAGGVVDVLRGSQTTVSSPATMDSQTTPMGVPMSLLACAVFLSTGGPARAVKALALHPMDGHPLVHAVQDISGGITLSVVLAAPIVAASVIIEVATSLIARAASPAQVHALLAPIRAMGILGALAIAFERIAAVLTHAIERTP